MTVDFKPGGYMRETQAVREKKLRDNTTVLLLQL